METAKRITSIKFLNYKALRDHSVNISKMNVLVGPNNCGKSTIIGAIRTLSFALQKARARPSELLKGPSFDEYGWRIKEDELPISIENIHTNYESSDTTVVFNATGRGKYTLLFPKEGGCYFFADCSGSNHRYKKLKDNNLIIKCVPVLGPLEQEEQLVQRETVLKNLYTQRASRNFRNFWHYFPEHFADFQSLVRQTWPNMSIHKPELMQSRISMFCSEDKIDRELYWSGFGFQIWCQLLSHIMRSNDASLLIVDEPEVYLHPDMQRQLIGILRDSAPDILIATHSTEIMSDCEPSEIVLVDKLQKFSTRLKDSVGVQSALESVGSVQNITLTRLARTKRIVFIEGDTDVRILRRFLKKIYKIDFSEGNYFTMVPISGLTSWQSIVSFSTLFKKSMTTSIKMCAIFDRDYYPNEQIDEIRSELSRHVPYVYFHQRKEIENYLLNPLVLQRAVDSAVKERNLRTGSKEAKEVDIMQLLDVITMKFKTDCQADYAGKRVDYYKGKGQDSSTSIKEEIQEFEKRWVDINSRIEIVPGKAVLSRIREMLKSDYNISISDVRIIENYANSDLPSDFEFLLSNLNKFFHD